MVMAKNRTAATRRTVPGFPERFSGLPFLFFSTFFAIVD
jgi:hypothetical protein